MHAVKRQGSVQRTRRAVKTAGLIVSLVASAYLMALANRSTECAWLGWFSLVPLFLVIRSWRPGAAMFAGALWGVCLYVFSVAQPAAAVSPSVRLLLLLPAIPAIYAYAGAWLTRRIGFNPFVLGVAWMGVELALGPAGLRTGLLAAAQGDGGFIHWVGSALGYVLVAFLVALVNASLVSLLGGARLSLPRERSFAGLPILEGCPGSQTLCFVWLWALCEVHPRAPPIAAELA